MIVESTVGKGSTFRVCFPGVARVVQTKDTPALVADRHSSGLVLVVDDEPALRGVARNILERSGYEVLLAADGAAAVEIFRQHASEMTAILLDLTMPVLGGMDAFHQIREIRSDVPVVVSTGYSAEDTRKMFGYDAFLGFIQKPYTASRLNERIHTISESLRLTREQV
jgi:CheY-like chemotaxis protein